ncbi:MAG TPA: RNA-binding protein [Polyangiaceae bacterium]|jgi:RNA recognition motif-containing protein|nr:RNA-binding protein [Polyangiaceae bacterium]
MSARLYVSNLTHETTEEELRAAFAPCGELTEIQVVVDRYSGRARGFAFVTMAREEQAARAIAQMNGAVLNGRPLRVTEAERRSDQLDAGDARPQKR